MLLLLFYRLSHSKQYFLTAGGPFDPLIKINNAVANVIGSLVFGQRYEYDDLQFQKLLRMSAESVHLTGSVWNEVQDSALHPNEHKWLEQLKLRLMDMKILFKFKYAV